MLDGNDLFVKWLLRDLSDKHIGARFCGCILFLASRAKDRGTRGLAHVGAAV